MRLMHGWLDSLSNLLTGLGTTSDKSTYARYVYQPMDKMQLEAAYRTDWLARKIIDIPAYDATREWRTWQAEEDQIEKIEKLEKVLHLRRKVRQAIQKARLYGGSALIMGVGVGEPQDELDPEDVGADDLQFVHVVSRWELTPSQLIWDLNSPFYGEPAFYRRNMADRGQVNSTQAAQLEIHPSRVIRFIGNEYPDIMTAMDPAWGDPILQAINDAVMAAGLVVGSFTALIQDMQVDVIQIPNMTGIVSTQAGRERLTRRLSYANQAKSVVNALLMDKEEEWTRMTSPGVAAAPGVIQQYFALAAGAADIPATRMLGQSPAGLNATGDSDIRNYYDKIKAGQENELRSSLERLDQVLIRSALGNYDDNIRYEWASLWQMSDLEQAQIAQAKATTFQLDVQTGAIPEEVLTEIRRNQLSEDGTYPGIDDAFAKYEAGMLEAPEPTAAELLAQQQEQQRQQQQLPPWQQQQQKQLPPPKNDSEWWQEMRDRFDVEEMLPEDDDVDA